MMKVSPFLTKAIVFCVELPNFVLDIIEFDAQVQRRGF